MENDKPSNDSECPMCGKVPEDLELINHEYFVWNRILNRYICEFCNLELIVEFNQMESKYFEMAASMVNLDVLGDQEEGIWKMFWTQVWSNYLVRTISTNVNSLRIGLNDANSRFMQSIDTLK